MGNSKRKTRAASLLGAACLAALAPSASAQFHVDLSVNVYPKLLANPNGGGAWALYASAQVDAPNGIAGTYAPIKNINATGASYGAGINPTLRAGGLPFILQGSSSSDPIDVTYFQDSHIPNGIPQTIVYGVGRPAFSPGPDPLGDPAFNNRALIAKGTYSGAVPSVAGPGVAAANVFSLVPVDNFTLPTIQQAITTIVVRAPGIHAGDFDADGDLDNVDIDALLRATQGSTQGAPPPAEAKFDLNKNTIVNSVPLSANSDADIWVQSFMQTKYGDANLDGRVNTSDFLALAQNFNQSNKGWVQGDFTGNGTPNALDFNLLAANFGFDASPAPSLGALVPEPACVGAVSITALLGFRRRGSMFGRSR